MIAKEDDIQAAKLRRAAIEAAQGSGEQRDGATWIARLEMVKGRGDLNERLKEALFRFAQGEPDALPVFVGLEEACGAIAVKAFGEQACGPVKCGFHWRKNKGRRWGHQRPLTCVQISGLRLSQGR